MMIQQKIYRLFNTTIKENNISGRVRMVKWTRESLKNYKRPTPKQLKKLKIIEQKIMKELYNSDFHKITWDKKCV